MEKFYRSIILFIVAFVAVVGFAPQAKALCFSDLECGKLQQCILGRCVTPSTTCDFNSDCDDGVFCNGAETCSRLSGLCADGTAPCADEICVEAEDACIECEIDGDCSDGVCAADNTCVECEDNVDCAEGEICEEELCTEACPDLPLEAKDFDEDGSCLFSKDELKAAKTFYKDKHKVEKTDLKESQGADKAFLKSLKEYAE